MRTTSDPKSERIKLRLNKEMKTHIIKYSVKEGITLSEYIRELIKQDMINKSNI